ncbi:SHD1 domain-containing protein [Luteolibacter sp. AS25]|uniref:SHD1 domain-containing protein n=1 Tax=Luteolibacter sp. AS25 TaxID=3135776 RepID=UPI00398BB954
MFRYLAIIMTSAASVYAEGARSWTSADGSKQFEAEFVSRTDDSVTLHRTDGKEFTFDISKLHETDQKWLEENHSGNATKSNPDHVFDTLIFGDSREAVHSKLKESPLVESNLEGIFQGRTGLNGIFRTKAKLGGLYCYLFFDWDADGGLKEITLHTEDQPKADYNTSVKSCWSELADVIETIHGAPIHSGGLVSAEMLGENKILGSHLWRLNNDGSIMLGTCKSNDQYQVVVRFTTEDLIPAE